MIIIKRILQTTAKDLIPATITNEEDWCILIIQKLALPSSTMEARDLKDFTIVNVELYYRDGGGAMA